MTNSEQLYNYRSVGCTQVCDAFSMKSSVVLLFPWELWVFRVRASLV